MLASAAFADQCPSGDAIKINDDYAVVAPDGYRYINHAGSVTTTEPVSLTVVIIPSTEANYSRPKGPDQPYTNVIATDNLLCGYKVGPSEGDGWALLFEKIDTNNQTYDLLGQNWTFDGRERYFCFLGLGDCSFNLSKN